MTIQTGFIIAVALTFGWLGLILLRLHYNKKYLMENRTLDTEDAKTLPIPTGMETQESAEGGGEHVHFHILNVFASAQKKFAGYDLLQALLNAGLRFGERDIFHYYAHNIKEPPLFSLACATKPGTFDIHRMGDFSCIGLTLFMQQSDSPKEDNERFKKMYETAKRLETLLGGQLLDQQRQPFSLRDHAFAAVEE